MADPTRVLFVDDDELFRRSVRNFLVKSGLLVDDADGVPRALELMEQHDYDVALVDLRLRGRADLSGLTILQQAKRRGKPLPLAFTGVRDEQIHAQALACGAVDCLVKGTIDLHALVHCIRELAGRSSSVLDPRALNPAPDDALAMLVGRSPSIQNLRDQILRVAASDEPVLVTGESGTGKEVVARLLHVLSGRRGNFVAENVASRADQAFETTLFGHVRGAFTGAIADMDGIFKQAANGTLLLDEIGDMDPAYQSRLLRAIQQRTIRPAGAKSEVIVTARLVCATNADLGARIKDGGFREDLFYRISVVNLRLPRLGERREDVPLLAQFFARQKGFELSDASLAWLSEQEFRGNVRQLENVIRSVAILGKSRGLVDVSRAFRAQASHFADRTPYELTYDVARRALDAAGGNRCEAARNLGIHRHKLRRILDRGERSTPIPSGPLECDD